MPGQLTDTEGLLPVEIRVLDSPHFALLTRHNFNNKTMDGGLQEEPASQPFLYAWGRNVDGELSIGVQKKILLPKPVQGVKNFQVAQVSSSDKHSALVTTDGQLYVCGSALHGKLGFEDANQNVYPKFLPVVAMRGLFVTQVATGDYHTLCLTDAGQVYAWGGTWHKKLGQSDKKPARVTTLTQNITLIGCGDFHSAALSQNGDLYTWGGGGKDYNRGQLGLGTLNDQEIPQIVKSNIVKFSCGGYHMMALDKDGELWSWGSGMFGETGLGEFQHSLVPKKVKINFNQKHMIIDDLLLQNRKDSAIRDFKMGGHHSLLLTTKGYVYSCGQAQHGQLGIKGNENQNKFQLVTGLCGKTVIQIAAGWNHSMVLTSNSDIFACGLNQLGQLGTGDEEIQKIFVRVSSLESKRINSIFAGGSHSWALVDYLQPRIEDYSPPSPVNEEARLEIQAQPPIPDTLNDLEVIVTEVKLFHRFLKISTSAAYQLATKAKLNEYMNSMQRDPINKVIKFQDDSEATGQKDLFSYTVMMVTDLSAFAQNTKDLEEGKIIPAGKEFRVRRANFKKSPVYEWILLAEKILQVPGIQMKYLELRPQM